APVPNRDHAETGPSKGSLGGDAWIVLRTEVGVVLEDDRARRALRKAGIEQDLPLAPLDVDLDQIGAAHFRHHIANGNPDGRHAWIRAGLHDKRAHRAAGSELDLSVAGTRGGAHDAPAVTEPVGGDRALVHLDVFWVGLVADDRRVRPEAGSESTEQADVRAQVENRTWLADCIGHLFARVVVVAIEDLGESCGVLRAVAESDLETVFPQVIAANTVRAQYLAHKERRRLANRAGTQSARREWQYEPATGQPLPRSSRPRAHRVVAHEDSAGDAGARRTNLISRRSGAATGR